MPTQDDERALEIAIADVQLLGSPEQVQLAQQFASEFVGLGHASLDQLLEALRQELRKELFLSPSPAEGVKFLRIIRHQSLPTDQGGV